MYFAEYVQSGTNERLQTERFPTLEQVKTALYGQAYAPKEDSIRYYYSYSEENN